MSDNAGDISSGRELLFRRSQQRAYSCLHDKEYSRAFAHFIVAFTIQPDVDDDVIDMFLYTLGYIADALEVDQNWQELLLCYEQSLDVLPYNSHILHGLATVLFRLGHIESAISYFQKAYKENPFFTPSLYCIDNIKNALVERWHFIMVNDRSRNLAFSEAIHRAVKDGYKTVLDIGAGSGILSMAATDAGADKIFACEGNPMMFGVLQKVIEANSKDVQIMPKFSFDLSVPDDLPKKVSLVITEIFDAGLFGENVLSTLKHAWENLISLGDEMEEASVEESDGKSDATAVKTSLPGKVIPHSATVWAVPLECESIRKDFWLGQKVFEALEIANGPISAAITSSEPYTTEKLSTILGGYKFLSSAKAILTANFCDLEDITSLLNGRDISAEFEIEKSGKVDAIAVWFDLHLDEFTKISTEPCNEDRCCWEQSIFCILSEHLQGCSPCVDAGAHVEVKFSCKGHLRLQSVKALPTPTEGYSEPPLSVNASVIRSLNSCSVNRVLSFKWPSKILEAKLPVIDISPFPSLGLKALKDGVEKLVILPSPYLMDVYKFTSMCNIPKDRIRSMSYEDLCCQTIDSSAIFCEPIEATGLLKKNIFEDIALLRTLSQKVPPLVFPRKISIFALLIESPALLNQARLTSDENCLGFKVSQFLNSYQSIVQQDVQLCRLPHEQLCDAAKLCDIDLNELFLEKGKLQSFVIFQGSTKTRIKKSGEVSGIVFWFTLDYDENCIVDTSCTALRWKQAVIILESKLDVHENELVILEWTCRNSCLNISVKKE